MSPAIARHTPSSVPSSETARLVVARICSARRGSASERAAAWAASDRSSASISSVKDVAILGDCPMMDCHGENPWRRRWLLHLKAIVDSHAWAPPWIVSCISWFTLMSMSFRNPIALWTWLFRFELRRDGSHQHRCGVPDGGELGGEVVLGRVVDQHLWPCCPCGPADGGAALGIPRSHRPAR